MIFSIQAYGTAIFFKCILGSNFRRDPETAILHLERAVQINPTDGTHRDALARVHLIAGRFDEAWTRAQEAVDLMEGALSLDLPIRTRCEIALARGDLDSALSDARQLTSMVSTWPTYCLLAVVLVRVDQIEEARRAIDRALEIHPALTLSEGLRPFHTSAPDSHELNRPALERAGLHD